MRIKRLKFKEIDVNREYIYMVFLEKEQAMKSRLELEKRRDSGRYSIADEDGIIYTINEIEDEILLLHTHIRDLDEDITMAKSNIKELIHKRKKYLQAYTQPTSMISWNKGDEKVNYYVGKIALGRKIREIWHEIDSDKDFCKVLTIFEDDSIYVESIKLDRKVKILRGEKPTA